MSSTNVSKSDLPPKRQGKRLQRVQPPLKSTRLTNLIYVLVILSTLLTAFYSYRMLKLKSEVGGWWNLALGKRPPTAQATPVQTERGRDRRSSQEPGVEDSINALAEALGMPSKDLARAIAVAVREYVPPASLSSIREKETGKPAVDELFRGDNEGGRTVEPSEPTQTGYVEGVVNKMDSFVGFDEP